MAFSYKTPGVYLEEIVKLPPSVASVETAIPCFFGITQKATELSAQDLVGVSKKINSFADYEYYFGGADVAKVNVTVKLNTAAEAKPASEYLKNMYYSVKLYFDNGGGPCYIHSIGAYVLAEGVTIDANTYKVALLKLDLVDEVTLIILPDLAVLNSKDQFYDVYNSALLKASTLQDKFVIIDLYKKLIGTKIDAEGTKTDFRGAISNNLESMKYGAAYFPNLETTYSYDFATSDIKMTFESDVQNANPAAKMLNELNYRVVKQMLVLETNLDFFKDDYFKQITRDTTPSKIGEIESKRNLMLPLFSTEDQVKLMDFAKKLTDEIKKQTDALAAGTNSYDFVDTGNVKTNFLKHLQDRSVELFNGLFPDDATRDAYTAAQGVDDSDYGTLKSSLLDKIKPFNNSVFESRIREAFLALPVVLPPSPAIAGVYASVDRTRGVWKAPANVSLNAVVKPQVPLSDLDQEDFNVDAENGKSINCIRQFVGRGNLVWGARTLAGNNNEWRYVNVRRFFNMVEESAQNACRQFVFEPNDANTWVRVKGMIDNFLTNLWRVQALQGEKPEHAFYTRLGLNQTMTQDDILNGIMIVEIGLAVVRPAEFIILRFSHKLAVS